MGLSDRVWNYTDNFMELAEKGIEYGIRTGADAPTMARDLKDYLKFPDKLFRRVRGADGELHLSEAAKAFHPGQGVYRSSYANAMRLARTEINMAYRTADYERYQQLDFVVGIKVTLSNNHTCKGVKGIFVDICDELQGEYPKDFRFVGWHPQCRCHVESILSNEDELKQNLKDILQGKDTELQSDNKVTELPDNFKNWLENNADRIERAKSLPYFLRDNGRYAKDSLLRANKMSMRGIDNIGISNITPKEQNQIMNEIRAMSSIGIFPKGVNITFSNDLEHGIMMQWDSERGLLISTLKYRVDRGAEFCVADELHNAFRKLKAGEILSFKEEYSIESLFHESIHARATKQTKILKGSVKECVAEACTQLYARDKYVKIMNLYGVEAVNFEAIKYNGLGYRKECNLLRQLFTNEDGSLQLGELINIANETVDGVRMLQKKLSRVGYTDNEIKLFLRRLK